MNGIKSYIYNGVVTVRCDKKSMPVMKSRRAQPRKLNKKEKEFEKEYLERNNLTRYNSYSIKARRFLETIFPKGFMNWKNIKSLATFISLMMSISYPREVYRRMNCTLHWIEQHYKEINEFFSQQKIEIEFDNNVVKQVIPDLQESSDMIKIEEEKTNYIDAVSNEELCQTNTVDCIDYYDW